MTITPGAPAELSESDQRLAEMILHVATRCQDHATFGATKLNKILLFAEITAFQRRGKPIVGCEFMKQPFGPVPRRLLPVKDELVRSGRAVIQRRKFDFSHHEQQRLVPLAQPDLNRHFSAEDIAIVDDIIADLCDRTAQEVSDSSHDFPAWKIAQDRETIPLEAFFLVSVEPTSEDIETARSLLQTK